jgi:tRNA-binding protein
VSQVSYDDFAKLDLRVAKIIGIEKIPGKTKIVKGVLDTGEENREVIIGGAEYYSSEDLINRKVIIVANLEHKKIAGIESSAMLLAAEVNGKPFWLTVDGDVAAGTKIR